MTRLVPLGETGVCGKLELSSEDGELPAEGVDGAAMGMAIPMRDSRNSKICG